MGIERNTVVETDVSLSFWLDFDTEDLVHIVPAVQTIGDLSPDPLEGVGLEELVHEFLLQRVNSGDYTSLYCLAHEFRRFSELLQEKALNMEDSAFGVGAKFNLNLQTMIGDDF